MGYNVEINKERVQLIELTMNHDFAQVVWNEQLEDDCRQLIRLAVREDIDRFCDWTTASLVPAESTAKANIVSRESGVISGLRVAELVIREMQAKIQLTSHKVDGDAVSPQTIVATLDGASRDILTAERILLNFMGRLSGIATLTSQFVEKVSGTKARIYDTRKTTPGWRRLEKYAVTTGGGVNHRTGLFAAVMIKDNHLALSEDRGLTPADAVKRAKAFLSETAEESKLLRDMIVEIEVDSFEQLCEVLPAKPDIVLLDNMSCQQLCSCVEYRDQHAVGVELEASGGVNLGTVQAIAETGVDRISVGAITHSAVNFDVGLDWI